MVDGPIEKHMYSFFWVLFLIDLAPYYGLRLISPFLRRDNWITRRSLKTAFTLVWIVDLIALGWIICGWLLISNPIKNYYNYQQAVLRMIAFRLIQAALHYHFSLIADSYQIYCTQ